MHALLRNRLQIPVMGSPLFIISNPDLVVAQCRAGIVGSFPALNARPASALDEWLCEIEERLAADDRAHPNAPSAPYALNQIVHKSNDRLEHDLEICVKHKVPIVITSLGAREHVNAAIHAYDGIVLHDVIDDRFARKAIEKGADGLIAVAAGAGEHATGVHVNYLKPSIVAAGLDPDALPSSDPSPMDFGSDRQKPKTWKEIWGCGQGIGAVKSVVPAEEVVARLAREYGEARRKMGCIDALPRAAACADVKACHV